MLTRVGEHSDHGPDHSMYVSALSLQTSSIVEVDVFEVENLDKPGQADKGLLL